MSPTFKELKLPTEVVDELARQMRTEPFPIQVATIPDAMAGRDVLGRAPTGSGKTLAFGLPTLLRADKANPKAPQALILSPTRELAQQIRTELAAIGDVLDRKVAAVYGGTAMQPQIKSLAAGVDVLVACPGRLEDLIGQGKVSLAEVSIVVIDEADRMADMGFLPSVRRLVDATAEPRQMILFSATLDKAVQVLVDDYLSDPVSHSVGESAPDLTKLEHRFWLVEKTERVDRAAQLVDENGSTIIFCRTRHGVDRVARQLKARGIKSSWIHGGRTQGQRNSALHSFTNGKTQAMVATDVAARGIHVDGVACVIHYDPPADEKDYVHRSGRTARAGGSGVVISLLMAEQVASARKLQKKLNLPSGVDKPSALPEWVQQNAEAWVASGAKSTRKRSPKSNKGGGDSQAQQPKAQPKTKAAKSQGTADGPKSELTRKPKKPKSKSSRSGKKRPAHRNGGRRKSRGPKRTS